MAMQWAMDLKKQICINPLGQIDNEINCWSLMKLVPKEGKELGFTLFGEYLREE